MIGRTLCVANEAEDADRSCHSVTRVCVSHAFIWYLHASPLHHSAAPVSYTHLTLPTTPYV